MTLKKTLTISLMLHICFFSAALLFSAGLLKGSGNMPEQKVIFVKLAADDNQSVNDVSTGDRKIFVPQKDQTVKKKKNPPVIAKKKPESVKEDIVVEKTDELISDEVTEKVVLSEQRTERLEQVSHDASLMDGDIGYETPVADTEIKGQDDLILDGEIVQASYNPPFSDSSELTDGGGETGVSSGIVKLISMAIERVKTYPVIARKRGIEGTVYVSFRISIDGRPEGIRVLKSSGHPILDKATVSVVRKAAPYPHIDQPVEVPVAYKLRKRG